MSTSVHAVSRQEDEDAFATVGKGGRVIQISAEGVLKTLQAVQEARGKKVGEFSFDIWYILLIN